MFAKFTAYCSQKILSPDTLGCLKINGLNFRQIKLRQKIWTMMNAKAILASLPRENREPVCTLDNFLQQSLGKQIIGDNKDYYDHLTIIVIDIAPPEKCIMDKCS